MIKKDIIPLTFNLPLGFGDSYLLKNGTIVMDIEALYTRTGRIVTLEDVEEYALMSPDDEWMVIRYGALHGETFKRVGPGEWICVEENEGFA